METRSASEPMMELDICGVPTKVELCPEFTARCVQVCRRFALDCSGVQGESLSGSPPRHRTLVGICGPPGVGKSVLAKILGDSVQGAVVLGMDAYHLSAAELENRGLASVKGAPQTFDVAAFLHDLRQLRHPEVRKMTLPVYNRVIHEAIPDQVLVEEGCKLVIVEGIHLFSSATKEWQQVAALLDSAIVLLPSGPKLCRDRVIQRKVSAGVAEVEAEAHYDRVDAPNALQVERDITTFLQHSNRSIPVLRFRLGHDGSVGSSQVRGLPVQLPGSAKVAQQLTTSKPLLLVIGPNPALQKTLEFNNGWQQNEVNRASSMLKSVGGKGQQFSIALARMDVQVDARLFQFIGGANGSAVCSLLEAEGIEQVSTLVSGETRTCVTLIDKANHEGSATELIEPSSPIQSPEVKSFVDNVTSALTEAADRPVAVAFCGTMPPGATDLYARIAKLASERGALVWLDGYKGVGDTLPFVDILKINRTELETLADLEAGSCVEDHANEVLNRYPQLKAISISDGGKAAYLFTRDPEYTVYELARISPEMFRNPIGAGDTLGAVTLVNHLYGDPLSVAMAKGLAAGSASCLELGNGFSQLKADALLRAMSATLCKRLM